MNEYLWNNERIHANLLRMRTPDVAEKLVDASDVEILCQEIAADYERRIEFLMRWDWKPKGSS